MKKGLNRFALCLAQLLFSVATPVFFMRHITERPATRRMVSACFRRSYRGRYDHIIDTFQGCYGTPLSAGLDMAKRSYANKFLPLSLKVKRRISVF